MTRHLTSSRLLLVAVSFPLLASPAYAAASPAQDDSTATATAQNDNEDAIIEGKLTNAVKRPFNDLNLLQGDIPAVLVKAQRAPYDATELSGCVSVQTEIHELDAALGPDIDVHLPKDRSMKTTVNKGIDFGTDAAAGFIPYRGVVRFVSGADTHDRNFAEAKLAGAVRRGYLKGVAESRGCVQ